MRACRLSLLLLSLAACQSSAPAGGGVTASAWATDAVDQPPRAIEMPAGEVPPALLAALPASVQVVLVVDARGAVTDARVDRSTDGRFDALALDLVQRWRFEPGRVDGRAVPVRLRVPLHFPAP